MQLFLDFINNFDTRLDEIVKALGYWTYLAMFLNIYAETGLVVLAFLPGDSLLFAIGAVCAREGSGLQLPAVLATLWLAAVIGNYTNFLIARALGVRLGGDRGIEAAGKAVTKIFGPRSAKLLRPEDLVRAEAFFKKYGWFAVAVSRFIPFFRTLIPFVAGLSEMKTSVFMLWSVIGGAAWVMVCTMVGYWCGNIPWVKDNFSLFMLGMFCVGFTPVVISFVHQHLKNKRSLATSSSVLPSTNNNPSGSDQSGKIKNEKEPGGLDMPT